MDEELRAFLEAMEDRLLGRMNDLHERLLDQMTTLGTDLRNTKAFLIEDALVLGRRLSAVEERLDRLERGR